MTKMHKRWKSFGSHHMILVFIVNLHVTISGIENLGCNLPQPSLVFKKIALEGNIAAGKSTLLRLLEDEVGYIVVPEPISKWQCVTSSGSKSCGGNLLELFYSDPKRWGLTFQMYAFLSRSMAQLNPVDSYLKDHDIHHSRKAVLDNASSVVFFERSVYRLSLYSSFTCSLGSHNSLAIVAADFTMPIVLPLPSPVLRLKSPFLRVYAPYSIPDGLNESHLCCVLPSKVFPKTAAPAIFLLETAARILFDSDSSRSRVVHSNLLLKPGAPPGSDRHVFAENCAATGLFNDVEWGVYRDWHDWMLR